MSAVRPENGRVRGEEFIVRGRRVVVAVLQAEAPELAGVVFEQHRVVAGRMTVGIDGGTDERIAYVACADPVMTQPNAPARHELIDGLQVPAAALLINIRSVEVSFLIAKEVFAVDDQVALDGVAVRRPFVDKARDAGVVLAAEGVVPGCALARARLQEGKPRKPTRAFVDVVAEMDEATEGAFAFIAGIGGGELIAAEGFGA